MSELSHGFFPSSEELAHKYNTSVRTIQRDLQVLQTSFGLIIRPRQRQDGSKGWHLDHSEQDASKQARSSLILHGLSTTEVMLLSFSLGHLAMGPETPWYADLEALKYKLRLLERAGSPRAGKNVRDPSLWLLNDNRSAKTTSPLENVFNNILDVLSKGTACRVHYRAAAGAEAKAYILDPACLFDYQGGLYIFARVRGKATMLPYALERFTSVRPLDEVAQVPAEFDPHDYLLSSFNLVVNDPSEGVRIQISKQQAPYVRERIWGANQSITEMNDGGLVLGFDTLGTSELARWVLSQGEHAKVLSPSTLVELVRDKIKAMSKFY